VKRLILLLALPIIGKAQEVQPVLSPHYLSLIRKDSNQMAGRLPVDTSNSIGRSTLVVRQAFNGYTIGKIKIKGNELYVLPIASKSLLIGGSFSSAVELKSLNRLPALQQQYVQGRSQNGMPTWNGPETGELFSYGPSVHTLEYDGSDYAYDVNGKLVARGTGSGKAANVYSNNLFRNGALFSQSLHVQGKYRSAGQALSTSLRLGNSTERLAIRDNQNNSRSIAATIEGQVSRILIRADYNANNIRYFNDNRSGFLNRVYQQSLLTPVSFSNGQGLMLGSGQRAYSQFADNPMFLLERNQNRSSQLAQNGSLSLEKKDGDFRFKITQSLEGVSENNREGLPAGSAYFQNGLLVKRSRKDQHYSLKATSSYDVRPGDGYLNSRFLVNYFLGNHASNIQYNPGNTYRFQRTSNDIAFNYESNFRRDEINAGINLTNRFYFSNTAKEQPLFLPGVSGYLGMDDAFGLDNMYAKLSASYHWFVSELPVGVSFSQQSLLNLTTAEALQYLPLTEAEGFDALSLIKHKEWSAHLQLRYKNRLALDIDVFHRTMQNDVFPFVQNGVLQLRNLADHQNEGFEIEAGYHTYSRKVHTSHQLSFATNRSQVIRVGEGHDFTPIAGFKNVYKALVEGEALGVIVGNRYLRNPAGKMIIGSDGFPLVDPTSAVLGNPLPDFVMKTSNSLSWKGFSLFADIEWRKGGDAWNGTQAVLDYYGRSKSTGDLRTTSGYVFEGVMMDGRPNKTPVNFYDASLPLERNRWVRNGRSGVAEEYIEKGDCVRINSLGLAYKLTSRRYVQSVTFSIYANNLLLWTAYSGGDPNRLLYDTPNSLGLDFFNLPSTKTFGCQLSLQF